MIVNGPVSPEGFSLIVERSTDAIVVVDRLGNIVFANPASEVLFGRPLKDLIGASFGFPVTAGITSEISLIRRDRTSLCGEMRVVEIDWAGSRCNLASIRDITYRKKAEELEGHLAAIVNCSDDAISSKDLEGVILSWNEGAERLYGYLATEIIGKKASILFPDELAAEGAEIMAAVNAGKVVECSETVRVKKGGQPITVSVTISPIRGANGEVIGAATITRDISARVKAQADLRKSEERYRSLVTATSQLVWVSNAAGEPIDGAAAWRAFTGQTEAESAGLGWMNAVNPADVPKLSEDWNRASRNKTIFESEYRLRRSDGEYRYVHAKGVPIKDSDGEVKEWIGSVTDVTDAKIADRLKNENRAKLKRITDAVPGMVYQYRLFKDGSQRFEFVSNGSLDLCGYPPDKLQENFSLLWNDILKSDIDDVWTTIQKSAETLQPWFCEFRINVHGKIKWVRGNSIPEQAGGDDSIVWNGILIDISEQKNLESQFMQAQKMQTVGTLAGGIAHDLNNQLTPVRGYLDLLVKDLTPESSAYPLLLEANRAAERCGEIVQRLLAFGRPSVQTKKVLSLRELFAELNTILSQFLPATISVRVECPEGIWSIKGNDTELQTVFINLAINAKDAMPGGGRFELLAENVELSESLVKIGRNPGPYVKISASDTGQGIPPEVVSRIFEPFFTTKEKGRGTGLGLAMVFKIVSDHGGWIEVSSTVGCGTIFSIYLPASPGAEAVSGATPQIKMKELMGSGELVLFVDDEEPMRALGKIYLERLNYAGLLAASGEEAIEIYSELRDKIEVIVMDMTMPKITGKECLARLLAIHPHAKIIVMSGFSNEASPEELLSLGAAAFLRKPYTITMLGSMLQKAILKKY